MSWDPKTKPTPANIRKRIDAARDAIAGAHALCKAAGITSLDSPLVNADRWLEDARGRKIRARTTA